MNAPDEPVRPAPLVLDYATPPRAVNYAPPLLQVSTYLMHSIVAVVIFWPFGIVALINSLRSRRALGRGDWGEAQRFAERAANWGMAALLFWLFLIVGLGIFMAMFGGRSIAL